SATNSDARLTAGVEQVLGGLRAGILPSSKPSSTSRSELTIYAHWAWATQRPINRPKIAYQRRLCRQTLAVPRQLILAVNSNREGKNHDATERLLDESNGGNSSRPQVAGDSGGCPGGSLCLRTDLFQFRRGRRSIRRSSSCVDSTRFCCQCQRDHIEAR